MIAHVAPGTYELTFELSGFTGQTRTAVVTAGEPTSIETRLEIGSRTEAVQVTGTLIPRPTLEAMSPVTTLEVEELTYRGITRLEDLLTTLPQIFHRAELHGLQRIIRHCDRRSARARRLPHPCAARWPPAGS